MKIILFFVFTCMSICTNGRFGSMYRAQNDMDAKYLTRADDRYNFFCFLNEPPRFNKSLLKGRWEGTIAESLPNATDIKPYPFTIIFKGYDDSSKTVETVQIVTNFVKNTIDTININLPAEISGEGLMLPYYRELPDKKPCNIQINLLYDIRNGIHYLKNANKTGGTVCFNVSLSLKKVSDQTELLILKQNLLASKTPQATKDNFRDKPQMASSDEKMLFAGAHLFDTIRILPTSDDVIKGPVVKINISDKEKVSILKHSALRLSSDGKNFIDNDTKEPFEAEINVLDLNDDGTYELIVWKHNGSGPQGASEFTIYYNKHDPSFYIPLLTETGFPKARKEKVDNFSSILIVGPGMTLPLYRWNGYSYKYVGLVPDKEESINEANLVGGSTPEELGKQLLKALQTNDFKLWQYCQHPTEIKYRDYNEFRFKQCRSYLEKAGLTNWNLVKFSQVTYQNGGPDNVDGETVKKYFVIEFTYNNKEFLGALAQMTIMTYKKKNYFLVKQWEGAGWKRYKRK